MTREGDGRGARTGREVARQCRVKQAAICHLPRPAPVASGLYTCTEDLAPTARPRSFTCGVATAATPRFGRLPPSQEPVPLQGLRHFSQLLLRLGRTRPPASNPLAAQGSARSPDDSRGAPHVAPRAWLRGRGRSLTQDLLIL